jgi:hypothetical protein
MSTLHQPHAKRQGQLPPCPPQSGRHVWVLSAANWCRRAGLPEIEAERLILATMTRPPSPANEIQTAIRKAYSSCWQSQYRPTPPAKKWPYVNPKLRAEIIGKGYVLVDLWELSNPRFDDNSQHTEQIIDALFPGNPLLCCGKSSQEFDTKPREDWRGQLAKLQLIVPSQMTAPTGLTKEGKESAHTLNNTGPRRFLICEFDSGMIDEHAALLLHLAEYAPLICAVHSGGKSLHGWFLVDGQPEKKAHEFFRYAVRLGADSHLWTRSQFVRMPDGTRDNGRRQTVYFLNFKPMRGAP